MTALVIFCIESFFPGTFVPLLPGARPGKGYTDLNYIIHASLFSVKYGRRFFGFPRARGLQKGGGLCYTGEEENGDKTGGTTDMISERDVFSMMEGFGVPRTAKVTVRASIKSIGGIEGGLPEHLGGVEGEFLQVGGELLRGGVGRVHPGEDVLEHAGGGAGGGHELAAAVHFGRFGVADGFVLLLLRQHLDAALRGGRRDDRQPGKTFAEALDLSIHGGLVHSVIVFYVVY